MRCQECLGYVPMRPMDRRCPSCGSSDRRFSVEELLSEEGTRVVEVARPGQLRMAQIIEEQHTAANLGGASRPYRIAIDAPVGVGKTDAYLVNALQQPGVVVLSTATLALQDQLYAEALRVKDRLATLYPAMAAMDKITIQCVRGKTNYLCTQAAADHDRELGRSWYGKSSLRALVYDRMRELMESGGEGTVMEARLPDHLERAARARSDDSCFRCPDREVCGYPRAQCSGHTPGHTRTAVFVVNHSVLALLLLDVRRYVGTAPTAASALFTRSRSHAFRGGPLLTQHKAVGGLTTGTVPLPVSTSSEAMTFDTQRPVWQRMYATSAGLVVIDEAHLFPSAMRKATTVTLDTRQIGGVLSRATAFLPELSSTPVPPVAGELWKVMAELVERREGGMGRDPDRAGPGDGRTVTLNAVGEEVSWAVGQGHSAYVGLPFLYAVGGLLEGADQDQVGESTKQPAARLVGAVSRLQVLMGAVKNGLGAYEDLHARERVAHVASTGSATPGWTWGSGPSRGSENALQAGRISRQADRHLSAITEILDVLRGMQHAKLQGGQSYYRPDPPAFTFSVGGGAGEWWGMVEMHTPLADTLRECPLPSVVLTSGTLQCGEGRIDDNLFEGLGLRPEDVFAVEGDFRFREQAVLYLPQDQRLEPDSRKHPRADYVSAVVSSVEDVCRVTGGHAWVLCTALRDVRDVGSALRGLGSPHFGSVVAQEGGGAASAVREYREASDTAKLQGSPGPILIGTSGLWQGVSVDGDGLRAVVVVRLPFPVPGAFEEFLAENELGEDAFRLWSVPQCILSMRQAEGRLIRSRDDRGVFAVLDNRLYSRKQAYGLRIVRALSTRGRRASTPSELQTEWEAVHAVQASESDDDSRNG